MPVARPPEPPTAGIDRELRLAILAWGEQHGVGPKVMWRQYARDEGHGTIIGALLRVGVRYGLGDALAAGLQSEVRARAEIAHEARGALTVEPSQDDLAAVDSEALALLYLPDEEFLTALEGIQPGAPSRPRGRWTSRRPRKPPSVLDFAGQLFARRGLPWSASAAEGVRWYGHEVTQRPVVEDAMRALVDHRLGGAADEWNDARRKLRVGDSKSLEDALEESAKSVESVLKVLLVEHGVAAPRHQQALAMFERLADPGHGAVLPGYLGSLVTAPANIRNHMAGHGAGGSPRDVPNELAQAAVTASATAIAVLSTYLP